MAAQIITGRTTRNSAKAAENVEGAVKSPNQNEKVLNEAFAETPNPSFHKAMAGMQEILKSGNYLNEAFSDRLSLDEKLSLIITELYKIKDTTTNTEENLKALQQQVQTHDQVIKQGATTDLQGSEGKEEALESLEAKMSELENDVLDAKTESHTHEERITALENQVDTSNRDVALLKGFTEKHEKQLDHQEKNTTQLVARSMSKNITISGLMESPKENCAKKVFDFLRGEMMIQVSPQEIKVAHRLGFHAPGLKNTKPRLMVVRVSRALRERILQNKSRLKDKLNAEGNQYFINLQVPEAMMAEKKALSYEVNRIKKYNEKQHKKEDKINYTVKGKQLYVEKELHIQNVFPPRPLELFVSPEEQERMDDIELAISQPKMKGGSIFVGLATEATTLEQVNRAYRRVRQMYPSYDHAMMAYRIQNYSGYQDDGEYASGIKMHAMIYAMKQNNLAVFVVRNFGGSHLGLKRFEYILDVAEKAVTNLSRLIDETPRSLVSSRQSVNSENSQSSSKSGGSKSSYNSASRSVPNSQPGSPARRSEHPMVQNNFPTVEPEYVHPEDWNNEPSQPEPTSHQLDNTVLVAGQ